MLRELLRSETQTHHERIERSLGIPESIRSRDEYVRLIRRFYGFYAGVEHQLLRFVDELAASGFDFRPRMKTPLLLNDLAALGDTPVTIADLSLCPKLPRILSLSDAFGVHYVLEGSTLGGQVISRHFANTLDVFPSRGGSFFFGYGPQTTVMWQRFLAHLNSYGDHYPELRSEAIRAACETFECLEDWLVRG